MSKILASELDKFKLKINVMKNKTMLLRKIHSNLNFNIKINNTPLQQVQVFCCLGSIIISNNNSTSEIRKRIEFSKASILKQESTYHQ